MRDDWLASDNAGRSAGRVGSIGGYGCCSRARVRAAVVAVFLDELTLLRRENPLLTCGDPPAVFARIVMRAIPAEARGPQRAEGLMQQDCAWHCPDETSHLAA